MLPDELRVGELEFDEHELAVVVLVLLGEG